MRRVLCIVTLDDPLAKRVTEEEAKRADCSVEVLRLAENADYEQLMDRIFEADSVQVW